MQLSIFCRWEFKAKHFDSVLLFKMGKFYEMFEMDAHTGAEVLGLLYMKVNCLALQTFLSSLCAQTNSITDELSIFVLTAGLSSSEHDAESENRSWQKYIRLRAVQGHSQCEENELVRTEQYWTSWDQVVSQED